MPSKNTQNVIKEFGRGIGKCNEHDQIQQKEIEEHIKGVQPKVFSKD